MPPAHCIVSSHFAIIVYFGIISSEGQKRGNTWLGCGAAASGVCLAAHAELAGGVAADRAAVRHAAAVPRMGVRYRHHAALPTHALALARKQIAGKQGAGPACSQRHKLP